MLKKFLVLSLLSLAITTQNVATVQAVEIKNKNEYKAEKNKHPRIVKAIKELEKTIDYLEKAPHDFGGHRASAVDASKKAIEELRKALEFRAEKDFNKKDKK